MNTGTDFHHASASSLEGPSASERNWAIFGHVGALAATILSLGIIAWLVPLLVMTTQGDTSPFVKQHAKAALNFQLTWLIVVFVSGLLTCGLAALVTWPLALILAVLGGIFGGVHADRGELYTYPLTYRFLK